MSEVGNGLNAEPAEGLPGDAADAPDSRDVQRVEKLLDAIGVNADQARGLLPAGGVSGPTGRPWGGGVMKRWRRPPLPDPVCQ